MEINKYLIQANTEQCKLWIQRRVEKHCTQTGNEVVGEIEHIIDWMNSEDAHPRCDRMTYDEARRAAVKWVNKLQKKGNKIKEVEGDTETVLTSGSYRVVKLLTKSAYEREGALMSHCVGSYHGKNVTIYSIRDHLNKPHVTIEVNNNDINQIKGKGNGSIHPDYVGIVLEFCAFIDRPVRDSEMENLGYCKFDKTLSKLLDKFTNIPFIKHKGSKYYYFKQVNIVVDNSDKLSKWVAKREIGNIRSIFHISCRLGLVAIVQLILELCEDYNSND